MLTDDGYRQIMQHARRLAQGGRGELAQHLRDAIDLRAEVEALKLERTAAELVHRETATTVLMQMAEVQRLRDALENVRLLAARHRKEEWAGHMLRFCADAGVTGSPLREGGK